MELFCFPMVFDPCSLVLAVDLVQPVRLIATDMDGTLTAAGTFTPMLLQALIDLAAAGIQVLIVTGRSAGWVSGLVNYLPIWGAIAENGGMFYRTNPPSEIALTAIGDRTSYRQQLGDVFSRLQSEFPKLCESADNQFRITDWTFDVQGLLPEEIQTMRDRCADWGWGFTYSTVQCHIKHPQQDKARGLRQVLDTYFPDYPSNQVVTVGDSPNDESLFDRAQFPLSVGVANVQHYKNELMHFPTYVMTKAEVEGFCQLVQLLLSGAETP